MPQEAAVTGADLMLLSSLGPSPSKHSIVSEENFGLFGDFLSLLSPALQKHTHKKRNKLELETY